MMLLLCGILLLTGCPDKPNDTITKNDADEMVRTYVQNEIEPHSDEIYAVYYFNKPDIRHVEISFWDDSDKLTIDNAYIYFIDEYEMANWGHPCRFMIIDKTTGSYEIYHRNAPPQTSFDNAWSLLFQRKE